VGFKQWAFRIRQASLVVIGRMNGAFLVLLPFTKAPDPELARAENLDEQFVLRVLIGPESATKEMGELVCDVSLSHRTNSPTETPRALASFLTVLTVGSCRPISRRAI
jgi:hypothetical protein